jgi:hypothetical protein
LGAAASVFEAGDGARVVVGETPQQQKHRRRDHREDGENDRQLHQREAAAHQRPSRPRSRWR